MPTEPQGAMSVAECRRVYAIGRTRIYDLIKRGDILAKKFGGKTLIDRASAERWYEALPIMPSAGATR